jgi:ribosomal protein S18 acetylase RimI-like enzyme
MQFRRARLADLPAIVALIADDQLGQTREDAREPLAERYRQAFAAIDASPEQLLLVGEQDGTVISCLQLSFIPGLSHRGATRAQIEAVRVAKSARGRGVGAAMLTHAIGLTRSRGCRLVQLTTSKERTAAQRFYRRFGFIASHEGMKLLLE